jgi:hypothetical protein
LIMSFKGTARLIQVNQPRLAHSLNRHGVNC